MDLWESFHSFFCELCCETFIPCRDIKWQIESDQATCFGSLQQNVGKEQNCTIVREKTLDTGVVCVSYFIECDIVLETCVSEWLNNFFLNTVAFFCV